jgi:hypothetical protein
MASRVLRDDLRNITEPFQHMAIAQFVWTINVIT